MVSLFARSMAEQEFLGVDQHPAEVLDGLPEVFRRREVLGGRRQLGRARVAAEGDHVELARDLLGRLARSWRAGPCGRCRRAACR